MNDCPTFHPFSFASETGHTGGVFGDDYVQSITDFYPENVTSQVAFLVLFLKISYHCNPETTGGVED